MRKNALHQLYDKHQGKVSDKWSLYLDEYGRVFKDYRSKKIGLLEIGTQNGGSLDIWAKYFAKASSITGCDINKDCAQLAYDDPRINVVVGDASTDQTYKQILGICPEFDIIIDDGSHSSSDIIKSFALYFPKIKDGGMFIAEDLHCSYWGILEGGLFDPYSSISFFKRLADIINHEHWGSPKSKADILSGFFNKYGCEISIDELAQVHSVTFANSMCIVRKAPASQNGLGRRVIAGSAELVVQGHAELHDIPYKFNPDLNQTGNPWTARDIAPEEGIEELEASLAKEKKKNDDLNETILESLLCILMSAQQERDNELKISNLNKTLTKSQQTVANLSQTVTEREKSIIAFQQEGEREQEILKLNRVVNESYQIITNLNQTVIEREQTISALQQVIENYLHSLSWRFTKPFRFVKNFYSGRAKDKGIDG